MTNTAPTPLSPRERDAFFASLSHLKRTANGMLIEHKNVSANVTLGSRKPHPLAPRRRLTMRDIRRRIRLLELELGATEL